MSTLVRRGEVALLPDDPFTGHYRLSGTEKGDILLEVRNQPPFIPFASAGLKIKLTGFLLALTSVDLSTALFTQNLVGSSLGFLLGGGAITGLFLRDAKRERGQAQKEAHAFTAVKSYRDASSRLARRYGELLGAYELHEFTPSIGGGVRWGASSPELDTFIQEVLQEERALERQGKMLAKAEEEITVKRVYQQPASRNPEQPVVSPREGEQPVRGASNSSRVQVTGTNAQGSFFLHAEAHGPNATVTVHLSNGAAPGGGRGIG